MFRNPKPYHFHLFGYVIQQANDLWNGHSPLRDACKCAWGRIKPCEVKGAELGRIDDIEVEMNGDMPHPCRPEPFNHGLA